MNETNQYIANELHAEINFMIEYTFKKNESTSLLELKSNLKMINKKYLRLYIESISNSVIEGHSPVKNKDFCNDFKKKIRELKNNIEIKYDGLLKKRIIALTQSVDCLLKKEVLDELINDNVSLEKKLKNLVKLIDLKIKKLEVWQMLASNLNEILENNEEIIDPIIYNFLKNIIEKEEAFEKSAIIFKIQIKILEICTTNYKKTKIRSDLSCFLNDFYIHLLKIELMELLTNIEITFENRNALKNLYKIIEAPNSDFFLKLLELDIDHDGDNDINYDEFKYEINKFLIRSNLLLFRLEVEKLLISIPNSQFTSVHSKIISAFSKKSFDDSAELYPELYQIIESTPKQTNYSFHEKVIYDKYFDFLLFHLAFTNILQT